MILLKERKINPWTTRNISFDLRSRYEIDEVLVSAEIFGKEDDLIELIILLSIVSSFFRESKLHSDDRLDPFFFACLIELKSTVHIPTVSDGNSTLTKLFCSLGKLLWISKCSLECIVCMSMEVDERHGESVSKKRVFASRKEKTSKICFQRKRVLEYFCYFIISLLCDSLTISLKKL